jgi:hypothetical protein
MDIVDYIEERTLGIDLCPTSNKNGSPPPPSCVIDCPTHSSIQVHLLSAFRLFFMEHFSLAQAMCDFGSFHSSFYR